MITPRAIQPEREPPPVPAGEPDLVDYAQATLLDRVERQAGLVGCHGSVHLSSFQRASVSWWESEELDFPGGKVKELGRPPPGSFRAVPEATLCDVFLGAS